MGVFDSLRESLRDRARDEICAGLRTLGVDARMASRGRPEEGESGAGASVGIIDIAEGPIRWINVYKYHSGAYSISYGVEVTYRAPKTTIKTITAMESIMGRMIDPDWRAGGYDRYSPVVKDIQQRLGADAQIRAALIATRDDVSIKGSGVRDWVITTGTGPGEAPTRQAWDCYQAIAQHLIAARGEEPNTP